MGRRAGEPVAECKRRFSATCCCSEDGKQRRGTHDVLNDDFGLLDTTQRRQADSTATGRFTVTGTINDDGNRNILQFIF
ncbi:unnamed protein product [Linum trigynum]|uniref:Uncharacterized protein n=1 Tax=Linum trigynum TaxID=586398 RepID=A0AAV2D9N9_9ROSI